MPAATGCARSMPWRRSPTNIRTTCSRNLSRARRRVHAGAPFRGLGRGHPFQQEVGMRTMDGGREYVEDGGLMSYGPDISDMFRRAADFVDKLPHGAKPGDMPVQQPTKFALVINLTTAKGLNLTVPRCCCV